MKTLLMIIGVVIAIFVVLALIIVVIGTRLPQQHVASRAITLKRSPAEIYGVVHGFEHFAKWRPDVKSVEMLGPVNGHLQFREHGANGTVTYELLEDTPSQRLVTRIVDRDLGYSGSWEYVITKSADGAILTITERGEVSNPLFRFMSRYVFGHTATLDAYLTSLARHFGEPALPQASESLPK